MKQSSDKRRLIDEQEELRDNLTDLMMFINSKEFYSLSHNKRQLLKNKKIAMELYLNVLNMMLFEDSEEIVVPDYGFLQLMGNAFAGNSPFAFKPNSEKCLEQKLTEENDK